MSITYLSTGASFMTIGPGQDDADISVPTIAHTLKDALQQVKQSYDIEGVEIESVELLPMAKGKTLIAVYTEPQDRGGEPLLLVYAGDIFWEEDLQAAFKALPVEAAIRHIVAARFRKELDDRTAALYLQLAPKAALIDALFDCLNRADGSIPLFCDADGMVDGKAPIFAKQDEPSEASHG